MSARGIVGRDREVAQIAARLAGDAAVVIVGAPGMGKTTLATAVLADAGRDHVRATSVRFLESRSYLGLVAALGVPRAAQDPMDAVTQVGDALGGRVLFLDDLQWADPDTVALLPLLASSLPLVVATRPGEGSAPQALEALDDPSGVVRLDPLDADAARDLVLAVHPTLSAPGVVEAVQGAGGNPLLLELAAHAERRPVGAITMAAVVDSLSDPARLALARLSLAPRSTGHDDAAVAELAARHLLRHDADGDLVPAGDLLGEQALDGLEPAVRRSLHAERARACDDPGEAASHWHHAGDDAAAHTISMAAATDATTAIGRAQHLTDALHTAPPDEVWAIARRACGAWLRLGHLHRIQPIIDLATAVGPCPVDAYDWELMQAQLALDEQRPRDVVACVERAFERFPAMTDDYRCWMTGMRAAGRGMLLDVDGALADVADAVMWGRRAGVSTGPAELIAGAIHLFSGMSGWAEELEAVVAASGDDDPPVAFEGAMVLARGRYHHGHLDRGDAAVDVIIDLATRHHHVGWEQQARALRAIHHVLADGGASSSHDQLLDLAGDLTTAKVHASVVALLAVVDVDRGRLDQARARLRRPAAAKATNPHLRWAHAELAWASHDLAHCRAEAEAAAETPPTDHVAAPAHVLALWARHKLGERRLDLGLPVAIYPSQQGFVTEAEAIVALSEGDLDAAASLFLAAAELHRAFVRRAELRCRWAAGRTLGVIRPEEAGAVLEATSQAAAHLGFRPLTEQIDHLLAPTRSVRDAHAPTPTNRVTARQREILRLVGAGRSSREIAQVLDLHPTTVDTHIRTAMKHLGTRSRVEAALLLDEP